MTLRVLICDDQALVRAGFRKLLEARPDVEVVGEAEDGMQAVDLARRRSPGVVLMDIRMPGVDGIEATRRIVAASHGAIRVLMLTTFGNDAYVFESLPAGARGFLLKDAAPEDLMAAIDTIARGDALLAPAVTRAVVEAFVRSSATRPELASALGELTARERGPGADRPRPLERRDRRGPRHHRSDRQVARGHILMKTGAATASNAYESGLVATATRT